MIQRKDSWKRVAASVATLFVLITVAAQTERADTARSRRFIHSLGVETRGGYIFPTNKMFKGEAVEAETTDGSRYENLSFYPIRWIHACHLRYTLRFAPHTAEAQSYLNAYQGIGVARYHIGNGRQVLIDGSRLQVGNPWVVYLFQGGELARFSPRLSLNYEWNFGASFGWKPYDEQQNVRNRVIGSRVNAYLNAGLALRYALTPHWELTAGATLTHFSNGNTRYPNDGLNAVDTRLAVSYNFQSAVSTATAAAPLTPPTPHWCYDLTLFGSWRRSIVNVYYGRAAAPDSYGVVGFSLAPLYHLSPRFRIGAAIDGVYDHGANIVAEELPHPVGSNKTEYEYHFPAAGRQMALGLSARGEFVMPFFTIGIGVGRNVLGYGELKQYYQILALKVSLTHNSYLNIGYNLRDFHEPNYLMLGIGYRFRSMSSTRKEASE